MPDPRPACDLHPGRADAALFVKQARRFRRPVAPPTPGTSCYALHQPNPCSALAPAGGTRWLQPAASQLRPPHSSWQASLPTGAARQHAPGARPQGPSIPARAQTPQPPPVMTSPQSMARMLAADTKPARHALPALRAERHKPAGRCALSAGLPRRS